MAKLKVRILLETLHGYSHRSNKRMIEGDSRMAKKAEDKKFQIQNNLAQTAIETSENSDPNRDRNDWKRR